MKFNHFSNHIKTNGTYALGDSKELGRCISKNTIKKTISRLDSLVKETNIHAQNLEADSTRIQTLCELTSKAAPMLRILYRGTKANHNLNMETKKLLTSTLNSFEMTCITIFNMIDDADMLARPLDAKLMIINLGILAGIIDEITSQSELVGYIKCMYERKETVQVKNCAKNNIIKNLTADDLIDKMVFTTGSEEHSKTVVSSDNFSIILPTKILKESLLASIQSASSSNEDVINENPQHLRSIRMRGSMMRGSMQHESSASEDTHSKSNISRNVDQTVKSPAVTVSSNDQKRINSQYSVNADLDDNADDNADDY